MKNPIEQGFMESFLDSIRRLDEAIAAAMPGVHLFADHQEQIAIPECGELRFLFVVSSLYKIYRENGGDDLKFLNAKLAATQAEIILHYELVNDLRTFAQHDVQSVSAKTQRRRERCGAWYQHALASVDIERPKSEADWEKCTDTLVREATTYLSSLRSFTEGLSEPAEDYVKREWALIRTRSIPFGEFDRLASEIAGDIGMDSRDVVAFRNQHYGNIVQALRGQRWDVDITTFLRKAITARLIAEFPGVIVVAEDLKSIGMKTGREMGTALKEAQRIWVESSFIMTKEQVIARLQELSFVPRPEKAIGAQAPVLDSPTTS